MPAATVFFQEALVNQMRSALEVISRTPPIVAYLEKKDAQVLRQVLKALLKSGERKKPKESKR
jgi:hypothetical protein